MAAPAVSWPIQTRASPIASGLRNVLPEAIGPSTATRSIHNGTPVGMPSGFAIHAMATWCHSPAFQPETSARATVIFWGEAITYRSVFFADFSTSRPLRSGLPMRRSWCVLPSLPFQYGRIQKQM